MINCPSIPFLMELTQQTTQCRANNYIAQMQGRMPTLKIVDGREIGVVSARGRTDVCLRPPNAVFLPIKLWINMGYIILKVTCQPWGGSADQADIC